VRVRLVVGAVDASAGELSTQAAPASDKDTPITPRAFFPRCLFCGLSDERAIDSSQKISKTARRQTIALLARWSILIRQKASPNISTNADGMKPATHKPPTFPRIFRDHIVNVMDRLAGILAQSIRRIASSRTRDTAVNRIRGHAIKKHVGRRNS